MESDQRTGVSMRQHLTSQETRTSNRSFQLGLCKMSLRCSLACIECTNSSMENPDEGSLTFRAILRSIIQSTYTRQRLVTLQVKEGSLWFGSGDKLTISQSCGDELPEDR